MRDDQVRVGMRVVVVSEAGEAEGHPPLVTVARVLGQADAAATAVFTDQDTPRWWLNTYWGGPEALPQMYRAAEILGVPAIGLASASEPGWQVEGPTVPGLAVD